MTLGENKKVFNIILDRNVKTRIDELAKLESRSSSNLINKILTKFIEDYDNNIKTIYLYENKDKKSE